LQILKHVVQALERFLPEAAVALEPDVEVLERLCAEGVDAALRVRANFDQPRLTENAQMFGSLGLPQTKAVDDSADREGAVRQEFHDVEAAGIGQGPEGLEHIRLCSDRNIPVKAYFNRRIFEMRARRGRGRGHRKDRVLHCK
jgi:hypothetical protein